MSQELAIGETFNRFVLDRDLFDIKDDGYLQLKDYRFNENVKIPLFRDTLSTRSTPCASTCLSLLEISVGTHS